MKVILVLAAALVVCLAESPRPAARLILLPRVSQGGAPQAAGAAAEDSQSAKVVDSGEYYVLTPEGKLQMVKYSTAAHQPQPFAQFQVGYLQYPSQKADYKQPEEAADYEARLEYRDVKPIPAPIYAYNPDPLVRILKR